MRNACIRWFVCPADAQTNAVIAERLPGYNTQKIRDKDGIEREVWECDWTGVIGPLIASRERLKINFRIFRVRGGGKMELFPFPKSKRRSREVKKVNTGPKEKTATF